MDDLKVAALGAIDATRGTLVRLSDQLHANPEVGFNETQSSTLLVEFLRERGFFVEYPAGEMPTAFKAWVGADSPTIALLAEYDALPEVGHGCGHNLIAASAIGAALGVAEVIAQLGGTVMVIGTPAEECLYEWPGKVRLLNAGVFQGIDATLMYHPWHSSFMAPSGQALVTLNVAFRGRPAHAAADPWNGANALDGVTLTFNAINALRQQLKPTARIHWKVTHGGDVPNIIHPFASALIQVRDGDTKYLYDQVLPKVENCARGAALATGTEVTIQRVSPIDNTYSNPVLAKVVEEAAKDIGITFGEPTITGGSTDFGNVSHAIPATYFYLSIGLDKGAAWHSKEVAAAAARPPAHQSMLDAARIMALSVIELMEKPSLVAEAWDKHPK